MPEKERIRVLIVDDHRLVREGLNLLLSTFDEFEIVGMAEDGERAVAWCRQYQPDVVLMDYNMPRMNGLEATRQIMANLPNTAVIGLSMHEQGPVERAMLAAGAAAFLTKGDDHETLLSTIREVAKSNERF